MANINKPLSQMTFSQAENLARQRNLTPNKYGATLAGTWTNQGLADALGVSIVKPSRSVYSSGQKVLATPTTLKPPPTKADVLSQARSLGDTTYGITQSPYNAATDLARTRYLNQVLPGKMTPLKAMAQGVGVTPEELNAAYLAGQQKGQQRDTTWTQTKAELDSRGAPDWFKVASALAGAHIGAQNLGSSLISDPALQLTDAAKVGLSAYSGYKSPENISTKQILNTSLPSPMMAEGGLVGYAGGGQYSATGIRPTPEQRPVVGALARMVQGVDKFARAPFGYTNPPVEAISDFLRVPELYRTMENYAYGSPLASGTSSVSRYLPRLSEDTKGAIEASTNLIPLVGPTMRATKATARAAAPYAAQQAVNLVEKYGVAPTMNVIKPKGGNWLAGDIEYALKPLRSKVVGEEPAERLKKLEDYFADQKAKGVALDYSALDRERARTAPDVAINRWIDNKLNKYIRNEMATPEDPIRALAERGISHLPIDLVGNVDVLPMGKLSLARTKGGFPAQGMGQSPAARVWEYSADSSIKPRTAGEQLRAEYPDNAETMPWLTKLDPETPVYGIPSASSDDLGFNHLIDELKAAMSPTSELPQHLRLDPKDIDKVTVPQAVERVSKINAWRAEQAAKAEKAGMMENLQAAPRLADENLQLSFVEKPGGAWVDIPETINEKGMKLCTSIGKAGGWCTKNEGLAKTYGSGENRLATLLDAEGRPHAQAKITSQPLRTWDDVTAKVGVDEAQKLWKEFDASGGYYQDNAAEAFDDFIKSKNIPVTADITELKPPGNSFNSERAQEYAKRDPQYKQKVTQSVLNFLNSGEWGRVADLHHYDIVDLKDPNKLLEGLMTLYGDERAGSHRVGQEFIDAFNHAVGAEPNAPRFMTPRQLREFIGPIEPLEGYAEGGKVKDDNPFEGLEPTFGSKAGAYISDKTTEGLLWLYDKLAERDKLSSAHKILLDTFVHDKRDPITAKDFNPQDLVELQNLIKQKEKLTGNKGVGHIEYGDYGALPGGNQTRSRRASLVGGDLAPRPSLSNSLGQFNYKLDPKTNRYVILDEYDFNPQRIEHMGKKHEVPLEHYGDYAVDALSSPSNTLYGLVRLYAGRKMPPGKGRKVDLSVPGKAEGGLMKYNPDEIAQLAASVVPGYAQGGIVGDDQAGVNRMVDQQNAAEGGYMAYAAGGLVNYDPAEIDTIVSRIREELHG